MEKIWIVGAGGIAIEYAKVLKALGRDFIVIGRGEGSARIFEEATGVKPFIGGLESFLAASPDVPAKAINCVRAQDLGKTNIRLMQYGLPCVLTEKPGFYPYEMVELEKEYKKSGSKFYVAYNRRFYSSVFAAEKIIDEDGGLLSFNFEFTEWKHIFDKMPESVATELHNLFIGNSSHVVDLAFFLGGDPKEMSCYSNGTVGWHSPANFAGAGITTKGILFNYCANWNSPGRWALELLTSQHRIFLKPLEKLQLQDIGSVNVYPIDVDDHIDKEFKPGFYLETKAFIEGDYSRLCSIDKQLEHVMSIYNQILCKTR